MKPRGQTPRFASPPRAAAATTPGQDGGVTGRQASPHHPGNCPDPDADAALSPVARRIRDFSVERWGPERPVELLGHHPSLLALLEKVQKFARFNEPVLITGESGTGKELVAKALHLLGWRRDNPFIPINCPQFHDGNTIVSELFGHQKGSFTGAVADHKGLFENAHQGVIFLDEIADLPMAAQVILLRTLAEGEFRPLGSTTPRTVNVRAVAATNRPLEELIHAKEFRGDLYFRLRYFRLDLPALRDRGEDWRLLLGHYLGRLNAQHGTAKQFSPEALRFFARYPWPGNIRELRGLVTMGYSLSEGDRIELADFQAEVDQTPDGTASAFAPASSDEPSADLMKTVPPGELHRLILEEKTGFWEVVHAPFLDRNLNRRQVKSLIQIGLATTLGSYRKLAKLYHIATNDYHKFMDFLRHHDLKPDE